jgi:hypothetical protein
MASSSGVISRPIWRAQARLMFGLLIGGALSAGTSCVSGATSSNGPIAAPSSAPQSSLTDALFASSFEAVVPGTPIPLSELPASGSILSADALPEIGIALTPFSGAAPTFSLRLDGVDISASASIQGNRIVHQAAAPLSEGEHAVIATVGVSQLSWTFTTRSPPQITGFAPVDLVDAGTRRPRIQAAFADVGSGIDAAAVSLHLNGENFTGNCAIDVGGIVCDPPSDLPEGMKTVLIRAADHAGNQTTRSWNFLLGSLPLIGGMQPAQTLLPYASQPEVSAEFSASPSTDIDGGEIFLYFNNQDVTASAQIVMQGAAAGAIRYTPASPLAAGHYAIELKVGTTTGLFASANWDFSVDSERSYTLQPRYPLQGATVPSADVVVEVAADSTSGPPREVSIGGARHQSQRREGAFVIYGRRLQLVPGNNIVPIVAEFPDGAVRDFDLQVNYSPALVVTITQPADWSSIGPEPSPDAPPPGGSLNLTGTVERPISLAGTISAPAQSVQINQQQAILSGDGRSFSFERFFLHEGTNMVSVTATDANGRVGTASIVVFVDQTAPLLVVESPISQSVTSATSIDVAGIANDAVEAGIRAPEAAVLVVNETNATSVAATVSDRYFSAVGVPLEVGENRLKISAADQHGNERIKRLTVTRIAAGSNRITVLSGNRQEGPIGGALPQPLTVVAMDADGLPLPNLLVRFDVIRGAGSLRAAQQTGGAAARNLVVATDASGRASAFLTLGSEARVAGERVRAWSEALAEDVVFTATTQRGPAARIGIYNSSGSQFAQTDGMPLEPLTAVVFDDARNAVPDATIRFSIDQGDARFDARSAALGQVSADGKSIDVLTDKSGVGSVRPHIGSSPGTVRVAAKLLSEQGMPIDGTMFHVIALKREDGPTRFGGIVLDHDGTPVAGVRLSIGRTSLSTVTDVAGKFLFEDQVPPGRIDLFVDGRDLRVMRNGQEMQYPALHFESAAVQGQLNQLPHPIYLPPIDFSQSKIVGGDEDVALTIAGFEGFEMLVKAHSVTFPDGSHVGPLVVSPVFNDRLPMVPPGASGAFLNFGWTIQPTGTRFDPPIRVKIPNVIGMKPGETNEIVQWDHDLATFVPMGRGTISEDGTLLVSDDGSGITKAGWGGGPPPVPPNDGDNDPPECPARAVSPSLTITAGGEATELYVAHDEDGVSVDFVATITGDCTNATIQWTFGDEGTSTAMTDSHTYLQPGAYNVTATVNCPDCGETLEKSLRVVVFGVKVNSADIVADEIKVEVTPGELQGRLEVKLIDEDDGEIIVLDEDRASGEHVVSFKTDTLLRKMYSRIGVKYVREDEEATGEKSYRFKILGTYRHTEYNTPDESECGGSNVDVYFSSVSGADCVFDAGQMLSEFKAAVDLNGNGRAATHGLIQIESYCLRASFNPPADARGKSYRPVTSLTFNNLSVNTSTIAICPTGADLAYRDRVLIVGLGGGVGTVKSATDRCPACCDPAENGGQDGHVDNYTDEALACGRTAVDVGNFLTIKLID